MVEGRSGKGHNRGELNQLSLETFLVHSDFIGEKKDEHKCQEARRRSRIIALFCVTYSLFGDPP